VHVIIRWLWCVSGVVRWSLLLLLGLSLLLVLLSASSPSSWLELISALSEGIVESPWIWEASSGSNEFYHLSAFCDFNSFVLVFVVSGGEWGLYNFI
jgi:hypothetical protein